MVPTIWVKEYNEYRTQVQVMMEKSNGASSSDEF
jgi:hypothetical protein